MDSTSAFLSFIERINDGYISGHTINSLITDSDYQRLTIRSGKAIGTPLGNRHLLPGYWFTVLIAPFESLERVIDCVRIEKEQQSGVDNNKNEHHCNSKTSRQSELWQLVDEVKAKFEQQLMSICLPVDTKEDTFPNKRPLLHITNAISHGCYAIDDVNGNATVTFTDYDQLCGYQFIASIEVTVLNKFASEFSLRMSEILYPMIEKHKNIARMVQKLSLKELFL